MVVDANVEIGKIFGGDELHGRGLLAAAVAAGCLAGFHGGQQTFGQRRCGVSKEGVERGGDLGSPASMLPATLTPGAKMLPHHSTQFCPVQAAVRPWRSTA